MLNKPIVPVILCLSILTCIRTVQTAEPSRPNILYIYVDDMGWGSIGPNGQRLRRERDLPSVRTPNLDALARSGVNFTRGYGCHVCSPARSSQQTGFHQGHTFADRNDPNNAKKAIRSDDLTMGDMLASAGYTTGYWGKWGYGGSKSIDAPEIQNVQTLPTSHGYQFVLAELHHVRAHTFFQPTLWSAPTKKTSRAKLELVPNSMASYQASPHAALHRFPDQPALQNHPDYPEIAYCDDSYAFAALEFVRQQSIAYNQTGTPFFGLLAVQIPHAPFAEVTKLPEWNRAYRDDSHFATLSAQTQQWSAMVTRIDAHIGNILGALEDPNHDGDHSDSVAENTLVVFQSDNGGPAGKNNTELDANGGLAGVKGKIQEGGIRVPLVMRWPQFINASSTLVVGSDSDQVVDVTDLLPTFCELAGVAPPLGVDGVSIAPTLTETGTQRQRAYIIHEASNGQSIIRGERKLVRTKQGQFRLYDLVADRTESQDIATANPDEVAELRDLLLAERVAEPRGFATTYHRWEGDDDASTGEADSWSDYRYENDGVTYMEEVGAPQTHWIAHMVNDGLTTNTARVDSHLNVLALGLQGNATSEAKQRIVVGEDKQLTARNELRLGPYSELDMQGGTVSSLRWIEVAPTAILAGPGTIDATVYNQGRLEIASRKAGLHIRGDLYCNEMGTTAIEVSGLTPSTLKIEGLASVGGRLKLYFRDDFRAASGTRIRLLEADRVEGVFDVSLSTLRATDGKHFSLEYSESTIDLLIE